MSEKESPDATDDGAGKVEEPIHIPAPKPRLRGKKAADFPSVERRNWLIHQHFIRKELDSCKQLIKEQLIETAGECEYALYVQAMISRNEGRISESSELLQACIKISPKSTETLKQIARNLFLIGKYKNAIDCYKKAVETSQVQDWEISHQLGVCFLHLKQYEKAEECLNEALSLSKHDVTFSTMARMYLETNRMDKAIEILKKGVDFAPENIDLLTTLGLLYLRMKSFHRAFELLGQAMTFDAENYKAILAAGSLMQVHGDHDVALTKYRIAAQKAPESAALWNNIAMCFFGKKKYVAAISCLKRATYLAPFDWRILYNLCLLHLTMQQYASAFQFGSTALRLKPKNASIYMLLATALNHLGEVENARKSYEEAYQLDSDNIYLMLNYANFLHQNKDSKQAQKLLKRLERVLHEHEPDPNMDKEIIETAKKLGAALQLGENFLRPAEKPKSSKERKKSSKPTDAEQPTQSASTPQETAQSTESTEPEKSVTSSLSQSWKTPASSQGLSSPSGVSLPPLKSLNPLPGKSKLDSLPDVPSHTPREKKQSNKIPQSSPQ